MIDGLRGRKTDSDHGRSSKAQPSRLEGLGRRLTQMGVSADAITAFGVLLAGVTALMIGIGELWTAVVLLTIGGLMDTLDGVVAKAAGTSSARGAFFDSVSDRVADGLIFGGVAWYLLDHHSPRTVLLAFAVLVVSALVSYERAKAESLGFVANGGLMERAERLILLGVGLGFPVILIPVLWVLLGLTTLTAVGRFLRVWRQAPVTTHQRRAMERREARMAMRRERGRTRVARRNARESEPFGLRVRAVLSNESTTRLRRPRGQAGRIRAARIAARRVDNHR